MHLYSSFCSGKVTANSLLPNSCKQLTLEIRSSQSYTYNIGYKFGENLIGFICDMTMYSDSETRVHITCGGDDYITIYPEYRHVSIGKYSGATEQFSDITFWIPGSSKMSASWNAMTGDVTVTNCLNDDPFSYQWWIITA